MARRPDGRGKWMIVCGKCGCNGLVTKNDDVVENQRVVWGWTAVPSYLRRISVMSAVIRDGMSAEDRDVLLPPSDPAWEVAKEVKDDGERSWTWCSECGCPGWTELGSGERKTVWAYENITSYMSCFEALEKLAREGMSTEELEYWRDFHDPSWSYVQDLNRQTEAEDGSVADDPREERDREEWKGEDE